MVYQDNAGKKIMGIASPGKSSGYSISSGNDIEIGIIMSAKDKMEKRKLKVISPFFFNQRTKAQFKKAAIRQKSILRLTILGIPSTLEKSACVAK